MTEMLSIVPANGQLLLGGRCISCTTRIDELGPDFSLGEIMMLSNSKQLLPTRFAKCVENRSSYSLELSLRFESDRLVGSGIILTRPEDAQLSSDDFYNDRTDRWGLHARWLKKQLGSAPGAQYVFPWGRVGVARDKSENVFIYLAYDAAPHLSQSHV